MPGYHESVMIHESGVMPVEIWATRSQMTLASLKGLDILYMASALLDTAGRLELVALDPALSGIGLAVRSDAVWLLSPYRQVEQPVLTLAVHPRTRVRFTATCVL